MTIDARDVDFLLKEVVSLGVIDFRIFSSCGANGSHGFRVELFTYFRFHFHISILLEENKEIKL